MSMDFYCNLDHKGYKALEKAMRNLVETTHTSVEGYYHKSIRLPVGDATFEFHGPAVKAAEPEGSPAGRLDRRQGLPERRLRQIYTLGLPTRRKGPLDRRRKKPPLGEYPIG